MTRMLIVAISAMALSFGVAAAATPSGSGYGQNSQTGAYAAGGTYSSTPLKDGGGG